MKMYAYLILAVLVAALLLQPLCEVVLVCKDKLVVNSAINNAVRAAKKESYTYVDMRDGQTGVDEQAFIDTFSQVFAASLRLAEGSESGSSRRFTSTDGRYNDFEVVFDFDIETYRGRKQVKVNVRVESEYKFKTKMLMEAQETIRKNAGMFMLTYEREYTLTIIN